MCCVWTWGDIVRLIGMQCVPRLMCPWDWAWRSLGPSILFQNIPKFPCSFVVVMASLYFNKYFTSFGKFVKYRIKNRNCRFLKQLKNMLPKSWNAGTLSLNLGALRHHCFNAGMLLFSAGALEASVGALWMHIFHGLSCVFLFFSPNFSLSPFIHPKTCISFYLFKYF